jgi:hypothetical protein
MTTEEGESSSKIIILKTKEVIKAAKDKDRDIKRPIKVVLLLKFNSDLSKLKEYLNKV